MSEWGTLAPAVKATRLSSHFHISEKPSPPTPTQSSEVLQQSLYRTYEKLPEDGRFIEVESEACNPYTQNCKVRHTCRFCLYG